MVKIAPSDMSHFFLPDLKENNTESDSESLPEPVEKGYSCPQKWKRTLVALQHEDKSYYLQVGAFREVKEADRMRGKISFWVLRPPFLRKTKGKLIFTG